MAGNAGLEDEKNKENGNDFMLQMPHTNHNNQTPTPTFRTMLIAKHMPK
jgi:hypothetical protein